MTLRHLPIVSLLLACDPHRDQAGGKDAPDSESDVDTDADTDADSDADTGPPTDTAPPFEGEHLSVTATFHDAQELDQAGTGLWVGDVDDDGIDEVLVGAATDWYYGDEVRSAMYLLDAPEASGALAEVASLTVSGWATYDSFADAVVGLPAEGLIGVSSHAEYLYDYPLFLYPSSARGVSTADAWQARIHVPDLDGFTSRVADCAGVGVATSLCVSGKAGSDHNELDLAGRTFLFDGPLTGTISSDTARTELVGDPWDQAVILRTGADLDGDGQNDLLVGALHARLVAGAVALVSDPPDGEQHLWSVAFATLVGTEPGGELGMGLAMDDLDGDGHVDVFASAPIGGPGRAYLFRGPFAGERAASEADVTVEGTEEGLWTGYSGALADLDADGAMDLAVAQPWSIYFGPEPGRVAVFRGPLAGTYTDADADIHITSGALTPDAFGFRMEVGDVDGDTRADLLVSAPADDFGAPDAGAVHLVLGSAFE